MHAHIHFKGTKPNQINDSNPKTLSIRIRSPVSRRPHAIRIVPLSLLPLLSRPERRMHRLPIQPLRTRASTRGGGTARCVARVVSRVLVQEVGRFGIEAEGAHRGARGRLVVRRPSEVDLRVAVLLVAVRSVGTRARPAAHSHPARVPEEALAVVRGEGAVLPAPELVVLVPQFGGRLAGRRECRPPVRGLRFRRRRVRDVLVSLAHADEEPAQPSRRHLDDVPGVEGIG